MRYEKCNSKANNTIMFEWQEKRAIEGCRRSTWKNRRLSRSKGTYLTISHHQSMDTSPTLNIRGKVGSSSLVSVNKLCLEMIDQLLKRSGHSEEISSRRGVASMPKWGIPTSLRKKERWRRRTSDASGRTATEEESPQGHFLSSGERERKAETLEVRIFHCWWRSWRYYMEMSLL